MSFHDYGRKVTDDDSDLRRIHPAGERNAPAILDVLKRVFPTRGLVLEIASGTGQHAAFFVQHLEELSWQPTDHDADALGSIEAWRQSTAPDRIRPPLRLDVQAATWPVERVDAMLCINLLQVSPWSAALGLLSGAGRHLQPGAPLVIYSPLSRGGVHTSPGNQAFDERLRTRNPLLGLRDVDRLAAAASSHGLHHEETVDMPANNTVMVLRAR